MNSSFESKWQAWLPHVLVVSWLFYLGITIWQHAIHSVQTPWGDALSYLQKAASFWHAVEKGGLFNPLNLSPTVRPPGTILMSYPFGLSTDFHGFHFRSVFLPILSVVAAVYIAAGKAQARAAGWWVAAIAFLISSLPMFYWFDWNDVRWINNGWGMVDNFQAGIAALAGAALVRSLMTKSQRWLLIAALLASFTFLVKQSGLMVMGLMALTWLMVVVYEWRSVSKFPSLLSGLRAYALKGGAGLLAVYVFVVGICVFSDYLSSGNFTWGIRALGFYSKVAAAPSLSLFHLSLGEALVLWVVGVGLLFFYHLPALRNNNNILSAKLLGLLLGSLVIWILGAWYWLVVQGGGSQIRYFYPFVLMGVVCAIPAALYVWPYTNRVVRSLLMLICFLPALNLAALLAAGDSPSDYWQYITGVSVSVAKDREEVHQAYAFLDEVRKAKKDAAVYFFPTGSAPHVFVFAGVYEKILRPDLASFSPLNPMDWTRGFAVRVNELVDSDYVLTRKYSHADAVARFSPKLFGTFDAEIKAFDAWLSTLNEQSGVEIASDGQRLRLFRIVDRVALSRAVQQFVSEHSWRSEFVAANPPIQSVWWSAKAVADHAKDLAAEEIGFGGIYQVHALSINRIDNGIKIEVWWEELRHEEANNQRYLFLHLVDPSGAILHNQQIALYSYAPPFADRRWRYGAVTFSDVLPNAKLASLAFGIYQPSDPGGGFLLADKGKRDWDNKRVIVPLP